MCKNQQSNALTYIIFPLLVNLFEDSVELVNLLHGISGTGVLPDQDKILYHCNQQLWQLFTVCASSYGVYMQKHDVTQFNLNFIQVSDCFGGVGVIFPPWWGRTQPGFMLSWTNYYMTHVCTWPNMIRNLDEMLNPPLLTSQFFEKQCLHVQVYYSILYSLTHWLTPSHSVLPAMSSWHFKTKMPFTIIRTINILALSFYPEFIAKTSSTQELQELRMSSDVSKLLSVWA